jgi:cell fate regulator YaaT (PSP1 superfamily)
MSESCGVDGGCSHCSFGQRLTALNADTGEEWAVVLVRFRETSRTRFFAPGPFEARANDWVIVETSKGEEAGKVIAANQQVRAAVFAGPLKPLRRKAEPYEVALVERLEGEARVAMRGFREQIKRHELPMKPIRAEFSFDAKRLTFYYSSETRIDFRALVRDLAQEFGVRIDLRQVGIRDEARLVGGVGKCGRSLCCSSWLQTYPSVTVKQAKEQDLPLNPTKISGACGRLLCCLSYENEQYVEMKRSLPRLGQYVPTPQGIGKVVGLHTLKSTVVCVVEGAGAVEFAASDLGAALGRTPPNAPAREGASQPATPRSRQPRADLAEPATPPTQDPGAPSVPERPPVEDAAPRPGKRSRRRGHRGRRSGEEQATGE